MIGPVALGSAGGRGPAPPGARPSSTPQPLGGKSCRGCKILSGGFISAMKYGCKPCLSVRLPIYVHVRLTGGQRSLCRHRFGGAPALGEQRQCLLFAPCALPPRPLFLFRCRLRADSTQGAMWCVSALSSGLSTVGVRRNVGSEHTK